MIKSKVISLRLPEKENSFIESVRGDMLPGEAIKGIIRYLTNFDHSYTRTILKEIKTHG